MEQQPKGLDELEIVSKAYSLPSGEMITIECIPYQSPLIEEQMEIDEDMIYYDSNGLPYHFINADCYEDTDGTLVYNRHYLEPLQ